MGTHFEYIKKAKLPSIYHAQVQLQLMVTQFEFWDFISFYPKIKPLIVRVQPEKEYHRQIQDKLRIAIQDVNDLLKVYNEYEYL